MSVLDPVVSTLGRPVPAVWSLCVYPQAREAGGAFLPSRPARHVHGVRGQAQNPQRAQDEAARRAKGRLRRYCAANRLNRLGTLTYAGGGCHDPRLIRSDMGAFFRELRSVTGGGALPYAWVPEWHKTGHGLHAHFAVGRFIQRGVIAQAWGRGFVHIKLLGDLPVGSGSLAQARKAAGYLSKCVTKSFGDTDRPAGLHRFDVAQGFQPSRELVTGRTADDVIGQASQGFGAAPQLRWSSADQPGWLGSSPWTWCVKRSPLDPVV